jgi:hypothetical protein
MKQRVLVWLLRMYPTGWRARYGDEFAALLEDAPPTLADMIDIVRHVWDEQRNAKVTVNHGGLIMSEQVLPAPRQPRLDVWGMLSAACVLFYAVITLSQATSILFAVPRLTDNDAENGLVLSSVLLLGGVFGLMRVLRSHAPAAYVRDQRLWRGLVGIIAFMIGYTLVSNHITPLPIVLMGFLILGIICGVAVWLAELAWRAYRAGIMPRWLALGTLLNAVGWGVLVLNLITNAFMQPLNHDLSFVWNISYILLFFVGTAWSFGLAAWLFIQVMPPAWRKQRTMQAG